jgi:hypothetical protein
MSHCCGRSLVRKRSSEGLSIIPMELDRTGWTGSLPKRWLGDPGGQNMEGGFPMVGNTRD